MKNITIVTPTFNEEANIVELVSRIKVVCKKLVNYNFKILIIDNFSTDGTRNLIRKMCADDSNIQAIFNTRNFGHIRSPYYGILQSKGDAVIYMASDLQDPPEYIPEFINFWEKGYKLVMAVKPVSHSNPIMHFLRKSYYKLVNKISDIQLINDSTGFGLYDNVVIEHLRKINDPYPFLRGLICELGYPIKTIEFEQPRRIRGISKNNFYSLYDIAMLGIISNSMVPIRIASIIGFTIGGINFLIGIAYLIIKLIYWEKFPLGIAPLVISIFILFGLLFVFIGLIGEYVGSIHQYLKKRPIVVEEERINEDKLL